MARTKLFFILPFGLIFIFLFTACGQKKQLNYKDLNIVNELAFDAELMADIRDVTDSAFSKATENPDAVLNFKDSLNYLKFAKKNLVGLKINESQEKALMIVNKLRDRFEQKGYYIYVSESHFGYSPDVITVLKTDDKFDLLRFEGTNGINYGIFVEDIIEKISIWNNSYGIKIIGVGFDFFEADYVELPGNIDAHAKDLYEFCPDIVDQGTGSIDNLKREIVTTKKLYLWWD